MEIILGFVMMYVWVHSVVIIVKKLVSPTTYEKTVLYVGLATFLMYVIGTLNY